MMRCPRCGNEDPKWFYLGSKGYYCRKCISFRRELLFGEEVDYPESEKKEVEYHLKFSLTPYQEEISQRIVEEVNRNRSVLVHAVCGAGKTELVYETIRDCLRKGKRIGIAISRRQVVLQLAKRLREDFSYLRVVPVCQGYTKEVEGDLIVCTTHQLYRYRNYFDVLVLDEPDAYPFSGNDVLHGIAKNAVKGPIIYLTATPDSWVLEQVHSGKVVELNLYRRPTNRPLPLPKVIVGPKIRLWGKLVWYLRRMKKEGRQALIYLPTIDLVNRWGKMMKRFFSLGVLTSKSENKDVIIDQFSRKKIQFLLCTTIMERGMTFSGIDVVVIYAEHIVFTPSSLIQIMGRVGRDPKNPNGEGIFLCNRRSEEVRKCQKELMYANRIAYGVGKT